MARAAKKKGAAQLPPSPADEADNAALDAAVNMMIGVLETWSPSRPLSSLNRADLSKLAVAAISGFVLEQHRQSERIAQSWDDPIFAAVFAG